MKTVTNLPLRPGQPVSWLTLSALLVLAAALTLRLHRLDAQSLWYDEGNSARIAERSAQLIIEGAAGDIHPPLYYLALHVWRALFGESEAALRGLSVACGVGLVLFAGLTARALFGPRAGLMAAGLVAVSPFAVYYSQEARMYALLALEAAVSTYALLRILDFGFWIFDSDARADLPSSTVNRQSSIVLFALSTAAGLYTHYAYPFVMIAQGACVVVWFAAQVARRAPLRPAWGALALFAGGNLAAIALFLPWLPTALHQITSWTVARAEYALGPAILDAWRWIVVGRTLPLDAAGPAMLTLSALALIGLWPLTPSNRQLPIVNRQFLPALLLALMVLLPFALLFAFNLYRESYIKFLLVVVTPLCVLAGRGIAGLSTAWLPANAGRGWRLVSAGLSLALMGGVVALLWPSLDNLYHNPAYARDDYRAIARMVQSDARPGDAVIFNAPNQWEVFTYYHRPEHELAPAIPLTYHPADDGVVDAQMRPIVEKHTRLFVLYYGERESDPDGRYERWLARNAFKADEQWVGNIRLAVYATRLLSATPAVTATFGDVIRLENAVVALHPQSSGGLIALELSWRARAHLDARYKVFVHVGAPDAPPVAQNDAEPAGGLRPTDTWQPDETIVDRRAVWLKPGTPPGCYGIFLGLYDSA
ncbi:MAG: glycosyltransferase family 39 protein, partial [Anaerolineae bacterium]